MISLFEGLPAWARVALAAAALGLAAVADLAFIAKTYPWHPVVLAYAALGGIAAWPFRWRARSQWQKWALVAGILVFAGVMGWGRVTGRIPSSSGFFIFSALVVALPVQRARSAAVGPEEGDAPHAA